jgi:hypothetical protein
MVSHTKVNRKKRACGIGGNPVRDKGACPSAKIGIKGHGWNGAGGHDLNHTYLLLNFSW